MVVGDVVSGIGATSTNTYFQPAASVECIIVCVMGRNIVYAGLANGVLETLGAVGNNGSYHNVVTKIAITNTNYLIYYSANIPSSFSGIQIK